jgi:hypothetical protein
LGKIVYDERFKEIVEISIYLVGVLILALQDTIISAEDMK